MNDWYQNGPYDGRTYTGMVHGVAAVAGGWELRDGAVCVAHGRECLPFSRAVCDEAAVAYALIALAKRGAAWGREVDAGLVRSYRAAWWWAELWSRLAVRARAPARAYTKYQRACGREEKMRLAIVRGWP